jgi:hypothetical protein
LSENPDLPLVPHRFKLNGRAIDIETLDPEKLRGLISQLIAKEGVSITNKVTPTDHMWVRRSQIHLFGDIDIDSESEQVHDDNVLHSMQLFRRYPYHEWTNWLFFRHGMRNRVLAGEIPVSTIFKKELSARRVRLYQKSTGEHLFRNWPPQISLENKNFNRIHLNTHNRS